MDNNRRDTIENFFFFFTSKWKSTDSTYPIAQSAEKGKKRKKKRNAFSSAFNEIDGIKERKKKSVNSVNWQEEIEYPI